MDGFKRLCTATTAVLAVVLCVTACGGGRDPAVFCSAAADVSAGIEEQAEAAASGSIDRYDFAVRATSRSLDRLRSSAGDLADSVEILTTALDDIELLRGAQGLGAEVELYGAASSAGSQIDEKVRDECQQAFVFDPTPGADPSQREPVTTTSSLGTTTTTIAPEFQIASPEGVATAVLERWTQGRANDLSPLAFDVVEDYLKGIDWHGPKPVLEGCSDASGETYCFADWAGTEIAMTLSPDPVGYELRSGPAWIVVDLYFIGE